MNGSSINAEPSDLSTSQRTKLMTRILRDWLDKPGIELYEQDPRFNRGDLVAVTPGGSITEYEVKALRDDLWKELRIIRDVSLTLQVGLTGTALARHLNSVRLPAEDYRRLIVRFCIQAESSKFLKHAWYLNKREKADKPNYFFLAVEPARVVGAYETLSGTPYGLVTVNIGSESIVVLKLAEPL